MLDDQLESNRSAIESTLYLGYTRWEKLCDLVRAAQKKDVSDYYNEEMWTFLVGCAYAVGGESGADQLSRILTEGAVGSRQIWIEVLPLPPRELESNTHLDLATGALRLREGTRSGIAHDPPGGIVLTEAKWYSDISAKVSNDQHRNQFARVIENALYIQGADGSYPAEAHVTLITPGVFRRSRPWSRLFQYKWEEYQDPDRIMADLEASTLPLRSGYSSIRERIHALQLHWVTFEELFANAPESPILASIQSLFHTKRGSQLRTDEEATDRG